MNVFNGSIASFFVLYPNGNSPLRAIEKEMPVRTASLTVRRGPHCPYCRVQACRRGIVLEPTKYDHRGRGHKSLLPFCASITAQFGARRGLDGSRPQTVTVKCTNNVLLQEAGSELSPAYSYARQSVECCCTAVPGMYMYLIYMSRALASHAANTSSCGISRPCRSKRLHLQRFC